MRTGLISAVGGLLATSVAWAGSAHFVSNTVKATCTNNVCIVSGKEAGLGDELQVHIVVTTLAACLNPGGNCPSADNKDEFSTGATFPVQNGKANFSLTLTASFQPSCSPPMTVDFSPITVTDTTNNISTTINVPSQCS
jgi:hypothetical protein